MKWDEQEGYVKYNMSKQTIESFLGLSSLDLYIRPELSPYITAILSYLSQSLVLLGSGNSVKSYIEEVMEIFETGATMIIDGEALDLAREIGISTSENYLRDEEIPFNRDRFILSWTSVMTLITQILRLTYYNLFLSSDDSDCPCNNGCKRTSNGKENDEWKSGVYPEDEEYDWISGDETIKVGWSTIGGSYIDQCTKCNRRN